MSRIRLNLRNLSVTDKLAKGRHIVGSLSNNTAFQTPSPPLAEITSVLDELDKAQAAVQAAKSEVATRVLTQDAAETKVNQMLTQLAGYVESVAGTDDTLITGIGMETKASRSAPQPPNVPQGLSATAGEHEGEIKLSWKAISNARSYAIESTQDPAAAASWAHLGVATSASKAMSGLTSGKRYWFRVAAIGAGGQSGWSEPATRIVP